MGEAVPDGGRLREANDAIDDRQDRPGFGYDFLSHNAAGQQRFIGRRPSQQREKYIRFFWSDNM